MNATTVHEGGCSLHPTRVPVCEGGTAACHLPRHSLQPEVQSPGESSLNTKIKEFAGNGPARTHHFGFFQLLQAPSRSPSLPCSVEKLASKALCHQPCQDHLTKPPTPSLGSPCSGAPTCSQVQLVEGGRWLIRTKTKMGSGHMLRAT